MPLERVGTWKTTLGPQAVNHLNQFTSVTLFFNLKPGVALGDATELHHKTAQKSCRRRVRAELQGEARRSSTRFAT